LRQNSLDETAEATGARQQRLEAAEQGMGLSIPGRGVQAPTLGYELYSFQVQVLDELGWNTVSPNNADNATAAGLVTPREEAVEAGTNPPYLPGHDFMLPGVTAGVNLRICLPDDTLSRQQSFAAAGGVGDRVVFPAGIRTRNPNQVDVLNLMNQQMAQGMAHLSSMVPSKDERCMAQLKGAITSALQHMAQYKALGMDASVMSRHIAVLENKLNALMDSMFKL
jgi:hypothetical protein